MGYLCTVSWDKVGQREVGSLCTVNWDKVGQSETERSGVSVHSELGQGGTKWDREKWGFCAQ